jgi:BirA family biotin operon repressor/biotin-[acetyl-CoA-carboxylase] ligase
MLVYTDSPSFADSLLEAPRPWCDAAGIPEADLPEDRILRDSFFAGRRPLATHLPDEPLWSRLVLVESARGSQVDLLAELCAAGTPPPHGTLCLAGTGSGFHGQRDRPWSALPGNLHLSAYLRAGLPAASSSVGCTVLPALAALDLVDEMLGEGGRAGIKWVNDILVGGRKVAGVITRTRCQGDRLTDLILGIGVNVETSPPVERDPFVPAVGCLRELAADPGLCVLGKGPPLVAGSLARRYRDLVEGRSGALVDEYRSRSVILGRTVRVLSDPAEGGVGELLARGRVLDIEKDLALRLEGRAEPVASGRLVLED